MSALSVAFGRRFELPALIAKAAGRAAFPLVFQRLHPQQIQRQAYGRVRANANGAGRRTRCGSRQASALGKCGMKVNEAGLSRKVSG